ncbi:hypothetical protein SPRG_09133 [Saprolegnia parasitica CBS 223.65]|uniref:Uncharacterized protein n=1 Tax=Saprolegnia parasitica (strain CBS 223.65) TaxID=695850 RepID=A0A067C469_SAPPC|nr:hypothetical protein SPRG_09133 [Saprolegnia parasitica CBS 223.65]KDO25303.1 hypothetical protein SPRG_09133 [Saprolegnia parasitica CBS 223.65]|eukprot:XP_012203961.1 hypothetical protein SPRG_09133 [Saprolegnia parasitica CBS 223.65]
MATVASLWANVVAYVSKSLPERVGAARQLLEEYGRSPELVRTLRVATSVHLRALLSTASDVLSGSDEADVSTWYFMLATAVANMDTAVRLQDEAAIVRLLRRVGPYMTLLPVALAASWLLLGPRCLEALETGEHGREYIWEGIVRAFNQCSCLPPDDVAALGQAMTGLLAKVSDLIYRNDFKVCVDIVLREATDLDLDDPRRVTVADVLHHCVASGFFLDTGGYRATALASVVRHWRAELDVLRPGDATIDASLARAAELLAQYEHVE